jgi:hypothetical protein
MLHRKEREAKAVPGKMKWGTRSPASSSLVSVGRAWDESVASSVKSFDAGAGRHLLRKGDAQRRLALELATNFQQEAAEVPGQSVTIKLREGQGTHASCGLSMHFLPVMAW